MQTGDATVAPAFDILLSQPDVGEFEQQYVLEALRSGWVAPAGPDLVAFEREVGRSAIRWTTGAPWSRTVPSASSLFLVSTASGQRDHCAFVEIYGHLSDATTVSCFNEIETPWPSSDASLAEGSVGNRDRRADPVEEIGSTDAGHRVADSIGTQR